MKLRVNYVYMGHYLVRLFLYQSVIGVLKEIVIIIELDKLWYIELPKYP